MSRILFFIFASCHPLKCILLDTLSKLISKLYPAEHIRNRTQDMYPYAHNNFKISLTSLPTGSRWPPEQNPSKNLNTFWILNVKHCLKQHFWRWNICTNKKTEMAWVVYDLLHFAIFNTIDSLNIIVFLGWLKHFTNKKLPGEVRLVRRDIAFKECRYFPLCNTNDNDFQNQLSVVWQLYLHLWLQKCFNVFFL